MAQHPVPIPARSSPLPDLGTALALAAASAAAGVVVHLLGPPAVGNLFAVGFVALGAAFLVRAWWIGPICARLDRIGALLEAFHAQASRLDRSAGGVEVGSLLADAARSTEDRRPT